MFQKIPSFLFVNILKKSMLPWVGVLFVQVLVCTQSGQAQVKTLSNQRLSLDVQQQPMYKVLSIIESQIPFKFAYSTDFILQQKNITLRVKDMSLEELLNLLFKDTPVGYKIIGNQIVLQKADLPEKVTISGYIRDLKSGEALGGASIYLPVMGTGVVSNHYGFYSFTLPQTDTLEIMISYLGYRPFRKRIPARNNWVLNVNLSANEYAIPEITVENDKKEENLKKNQLGGTEISPDMLISAPAINGSGDVLSAIQMLPGVQAGIEGTPGYYVRGGNADQNLIELDEATLYNPGHLYGLVSIFNTAAVKTASLYKGGFPVQYGDHLSSILDITMKEGNNQHLEGSIQLGSIASGLTLGGPIVKNKASYFFSLRRSTVDLLFRPFLSRNNYTDYYFYDMNGKVNFQLSKKDRIYLSFYKGMDLNAIAVDSTDESAKIHYGINFGNTTLSFRWNHLYSNKVFANTSLVYNNYYLSLAAIQQEYYAQLYSGITDISLKHDYYYYPDLKQQIRAGISYLYQTIYPASVSDKIPPGGVMAVPDPKNIPGKASNRWAAYISDDVKLSQHFSAYLGGRASLYSRDATTYFNVEPRLSLLYLMNPTTSIKAAYTNIHQYIHQVQSFNASFPAEIWIGSSQLVRPESSDQLSAGLFKNFKGGLFQSSIEVYYKSMQHQLLFRGGTQPTITSEIENALVFGRGWSYGTECLIGKSKGRLTGWLAYSLSYAYQQFDSLNLGMKFPQAYDRRHSVYVAAEYALDPHWFIAANFFAASGRAFTLYTYQAAPANPDNNPLFDDENNNGSTEYLDPNNYRLTPYNRLDMSVRYRKRIHLFGKECKSEWNFSVYNVYARRNANFVYRTIDPVTKQPVARQLSFLPIIPSIAYRLSF